MKYEVTVFFDGPRSQWTETLHPDEIIFHCKLPWLWLARSCARSHIGNTGRCAYVIKSGDRTVEELRV